MIQTKRRLPAEWEEQDGVLMAWPHSETDWGSDLDAVRRVTIDIAREITKSERLVVAAPDPEEAWRALRNGGISPDRVQVYSIETNDTWARDFGPITIIENNEPVLLDFGFNGWGLKFPADLDNQITRKLHKHRAFGSRRLETVGLVLEGGSIESDGRGTILTTAQCLLSPNRNPHLDRSDIEAFFIEKLGAERVLWIEAGHLAGDDTDAHVDTLARFCPGDTIVYTACDDAADEHCAPLREMAEGLKSLRTAEGRPYGLIPLPWPSACHDEQGQRVPATYANFLIINGSVLVPTYGCKQDSEAIEIIARVFPDRRVTGIPCLPLLTGRGSLHCITMQIPKGVLA
ncbi:MAG: agmatine deiminase family protein [Syntrophobacteraceae bacterium]